MTTMLRSLLTATLAFALVVLPIPVSSAAAVPAADPAQTLANLQAAFNGESNAHARYLVFADEASAEGYGDVASLFRAAARAEEIHAANHAAVIESMGGVPTAKVETPEAKSTEENLAAAIAGESYERDTMYPEFLAQARADRNRDAIETFNQAKTAEAEHAKLYQGALDDLASLAGSSGMTYYVCTVCGFTVTKIDFDKCPSCFNPKDKYVALT
jgi:rubrerythrin